MCSTVTGVLGHSEISTPIHGSRRRIIEIGHYETCGPAEVENITRHNSCQCPGTHITIELRRSHSRPGTFTPRGH